MLVERCRSAARKQLTEASLDDRMDGIAWNHDAGALLDEHTPTPTSGSEDVMANQSDLVRPGGKAPHRAQLQGCVESAGAQRSGLPR
ncbi:MAG: hypothetical protein R2710_13605 [Acidimicrobiales bacterium]